MSARTALALCVALLALGSAPAQADQVTTRSLSAFDLAFRFPPHPVDPEAAIEGGREGEGEAEREREREGEGEREVSGPGESEEADNRSPRANPDPAAQPSSRAFKRGARTALGFDTSFDGPTLADSNAFPPDTMGDVGPTQFVVAINGRIRSYDKSTGLPDGGIDMDMDAFWSVSAPNFTSDPHIRFDRRADRWVVIIIDVPGGDGAIRNHLLLASSDGPTIGPSTVWTRHSINSDDALTFLDYPTLGVDKDALYIGGNNFSLAGSYTGSPAYVIKKSEAYAGATVTPARTLLAPSNSTGMFTPQGVDAYDDSGNGGYFIGVDNGFYGRLDIVRVTTPATSPTFGTLQTLSVPPTVAPDTVAHLGNAGGNNGRLDALDDRLFAASLRDGRIYTAHNIEVNASGNAATNGNRDGSRWYEVDVSGGTPSLAKSGTVYDSASSGPRSFWIPTVGVNGQGTMALGGSAAGQSDHANAFFTSRLPGDPNGQMDAPTIYTNTSAAYNPPGDSGGSSGRRWGDYSFVGVDPTDDQTLWTIQEYVSATNTWGTRIARLRPAPPAAPTSGSAVGGQPSTTATIGGGSGWFQPDAGVPNRFTVDMGCGVNVLSVDSVAPTSATLTVDTSAATGTGTCDVTVHNPDGQQATGSAALTVAPGALLGQATATASESAGSVPITVRRTSSAGSASVRLRTSGGSATPGSDYAAIDQVVAFADGESEKTVPLAVTDDTAAEADETVVLTLADPASLVLGVPATETVTLADNDVEPTPTTTTTTTAPTTTTTTKPTPTPTPQAARCVVPKLNGRTLTGARKLLKRARCRLGKVTRKSTRSRTVKRRRVLSSSPKAGTKLALNAKVKLTLRK